ncbi:MULTISPECIES: RodZ domain-containing protein [unclassified Pseudomonas]|uniref:RodZ domain-containing protein n=1 Tax=unclassified Pseudomonas TaxID=196821 RepID=UPI000BD595D2|nr:MULTISPECIES: RodZ domain-containing protein [unclassified Pseudomonas]PVZ12459.1 cytoskeleton protein RodZ [Pseudomonas sp. URIL14HWK12:I12]PVZ23389.1 cytoskeleton protein RodZ [Pseudomonas sp. URIL14HWK12:I10]PVZ32719.1 cytoskeleton protein RodZ [Pseudomonas sp. URIL14HWK12:I11]SNZ13894.1 cytoskeleton protein RodZ [Pseudomonas sp. URIL14HWK12:I9]
MKVADPEVVAAARTNPGETLRLARESRGWTLPEVATRLNLTQLSLANLEAGAFDRLPGHTFARGYIRAYAKLLGMDQGPLVEAFDQATGTNAKGSEVHGLGRIEEPVRLSHNLLRIVSLVLLVALVGGGFVWWQDQYGNHRDTSSVPMEHVEVESADGTTQIHPIDEPEPPVGSTAQSGVIQPPVPGQVEQPAPSAPAQPAPEAPAAAQPSAPVQNHTQPPAAVASNPAPAASAAPNAAAQVPAPVTQAAPPAAGEGQVRIAFIADCWYQITDGNGKVVLSGLKHKGDSVDYNGKPPFQVRLGFARGAEVSYNGQPVDVKPFTSGETARVKLGQ